MFNKKSDLFEIAYDNRKYRIEQNRVQKKHSNLFKEHRHNNTNRQIQVVVLIRKSD